jgi:aspartate kinase
LGSQVSILKFGGSSLNSEAKLECVADAIFREREEGYRVVVVASAFRGVTDLLYRWVLKPESLDMDKFYSIHGGCLKWLTQEYLSSFESELTRKLEHLARDRTSPWLIDDILAMGETFSSNILYRFIMDKGLESSLKGFYDPDFPTRGGGEFGNARIDLDATAEACREILKRDLSRGECLVIPGMGCISSYDGRIRVRRGASDYVATSLSYGLRAKRLWILSDVHGIKAADSSIIPDAETIPELTVGELLDAGALGAKNTNTTFFLPLTRYCPPETYFAKFDEREGPKTRITERREEGNERAARLVAGREILLYTFTGYDIEDTVLNLEGELSKTFDFIRGGGFKRERYFAFFDVDQKPRIDDVIASKAGDLEVSSSRMGLVGLVGEGMRTAKKVIERMGRALGDINILYALDISRISVGAIVEREYLKPAIQRLYLDFID